MRLWSLHPSYLDAKGLVALWRETLLAKKVLENKTNGYRNHPQLERFKAQRNPLAAINYFLYFIHLEAQQRNYNFDATKFTMPKSGRIVMEVTSGQLQYEMKHLLKKLAGRDAARYKKLKGLKKLHPHPLFSVIKGKTGKWEVIS